MRIKVPIAMLALSLIAAPPVEAAPERNEPDFVVATNGSDAWSGTQATPNRAKNDGPFATLERAQQAVRALRQREPNRHRPVVVQVRRGTYFLDKPLTFTPEDSGTEQSPTLFEAFPGEKPVLSGGRRITGFKPTAAGRWEVTLPEVARGDAYFSQLYVNDARRQRPRLPESGYYFVAAEMAPSPEAAKKGHDRFRFREGDIRADWQNRDDVEVVAIHIWSASRMRIKSVDTAAQTVAFTGTTRGLNYWAAFRQNNRYLVENVKEALGKPGQWYLERKSGLLTYLPLPGETPDKATVIAPALPQLLRIDGDIPGKRWVRQVHFKNLTFAHNAWNMSPEGNSYPQAEVNLPGAIQLTGARNCVLEGCRVENVATYAVEIGPGSKQNRIENCELTEMGAGGIKIGETAYRDEDEAVASHNIVRDCRIAHGGRIHPAGIGVWIGHAHHNTIEHNDIHDFYYSGISGGWSWGYGKSHAHHNVYARNHVHTLGQGVLSDMGGIYLLGVSPGTRVVGNVFHDVNSFDYGGWGIYFDEGSTDVVAENNLTYRTKTGGFHQHYGKNNVVRNNIFAFDESAQIARTRREEHLSFTFERNIVYWKEAALLRGNWSDNFVIDHNLYYDASGKPPRFLDMTLAEWQAKGHDTHSLVADPLFVNPGKDDFRLRPGSPAARIGFQPFDISGAGRRTKPAARVKKAARAFPPPPPPPPPQPISEDFEETPVGGKAIGATTHEENEKATIRVTEETAAAGGKRSLKFTDAGGQQNRFNPHLHYQPTFATGTLEGRFAIRWERGAVFYHEWRDAASPYHVGPSIRIQADGTLLAGDKALTQLPHGSWIRLEIVCGLGADAKGTYDLTVVLPGRTPPQRYRNLPCSPEFKTLRWYGFVADADGPGIFYLDNIELKPYVAP